MPGIISSLEQIRDINVFGGKADGLYFLKSHGFKVPDFYVLDFSTVQQCINDVDFINFLVTEWLVENKISENSLWAVRSSASVEDSEQESYAGLFQTELNVKPTELSGAIKNVINSYLVLRDRKPGGIKNSNFAVIIQQMVLPDYSGVLFTQNPIDQEDKAIVINIIPGLGENLVSGKETALTGYVKKNKITWCNVNNQFKGTLYIDGNQTVSKQGSQIIKETGSRFGELIRGAQKLEQLKKMPLDIEFAFSGNVIYWLQARPITTLRNEENVIVFDNSNIGENYPGTTLPLSISFVKHTYSLAYSNMARHLGMGKHDIERNHLLFENMVYGIFGSLYYNVTAWQLLLYQFPFGRKTSRAITRLLGMEDAAFKLPRSRPGITRYFRLFKNIVKTFFMLGRLKRSYEAICEKVLTENNFENLKLKTRDELILHYTELEKKLGENWQAPVLNGFYLMLFYSLLRKIVFKSRIIRHYPNFINDMLYAQGDIISVKIVRDFQKLITEISKPGQLRDFIQSHTAIDILEQMGVKFPDFSKLVEQYIMHYGVRCGSGELKIETKNYQEDPVQFIELLKTNINQANPVGVQLPVFEYNKVIKQLYKYNPLKRWIILYLTRHTIDTMRDRENYRFIRTRVFAYIRLIFRAFDEKLFEKNRILNRGDSLYLELHELMDVEKETGYIGLIEQRKQEYHTFNSMHRANRYHKVGERFIPVEKKKKFKAGKSIKGTGCCSGIVTGKVKIITADTLSDAGFEDRILVASYFEPGWINLFSRAKGLVSEKGNILSHTAILCREMGIPSIIGAKGIIPACSDDDLIQINGATGEINILKDGK